MQETLLALDLPPGFVNNGTKYLAKGRWYSGNLVRWRGKTLQPVGGWAERTLNSGSISGIPRGAHTWIADAQSQNFHPIAGGGEGIVAVGSTAGLYYLSANGAANSTLTDITPSAIASASDTRHWHLENFGNYLIAVENLAGAYSGNVYFWNPAQSLGATPPALAASDAAAFGATGPTTARASVATPERFLFMLGTTNPRTVQWPSQESVTDWTPASTNTAGDFELQTRGDLVCGKVVRGGQTLLWTSADLWGANYIGGTLVYGFQRMGDHCGAIGPNVVATLDTAAYWMSHRSFFAFDGYVRPIPCDVEDYVFGDINSDLSYRFWVLPNPQFGEVTWFYVSAGATEIDSYVTFHYEAGYWTFGALVRTAGVGRQPGHSHTGPVMFGTDGVVYDHESGNARTGLTANVESGPVELGDGDSVMRIQRIVPDDKTEGDVSASLLTSMFPNGSETTNGPYTLASPTSVRLTARQVRLKLTEVEAEAWRVGAIRLGVREGGRR